MEYLSPLPAEVAGTRIAPIMRIDLGGLKSDQFDQLELVMAAVSKSQREGYFRAGVAWCFEGEAEDPQILERTEPFMGYYYSFYRGGKSEWTRFRVPLAQRFMRAPVARLKYLYVILPDLPEFAIREIKLSRFDE